MTTVLLVDDYEPLLVAWERDLSAAGKTVVTAQDVDTAVRLARETKPDLALVDLYLSGGASGVDVVHGLRELDAEMFIILLSAKMSVAYAMEGTRAGADDVMFKSIPLRQMLRRVETGVLPPMKSTVSLDELEWEHITRVLLECNNNITLAAKRLGIYRQTLQRKLRKRLHGM